MGVVRLGLWVETGEQHSEYSRLMWTAGNFPRRGKWEWSDKTQDCRRKENNSDCLTVARHSLPDTPVVGDQCCLKSYQLLFKSASHTNTHASSQQDNLYSFTTSNLLYSVYTEVSLKAQDPELCSLYAT